jgi:hypothetical protein
VRTPSAAGRWCRRNCCSSCAAYRDQQGGLKTIDDLKKAPGLDAAKIDALKDRLLFR